MAKKIKDDEQKKLLQLYENSKSGNDDEVDAFYNYLAEVGIDPDEVAEYLAVKNGPETEQEKRLERKDKAANDWSTEGAISMEDVAKAYNAPTGEDSYRVGKLDSYIRKNGIFSKVEGETGKEFADRNRNAFEKLGLNWDNLEDRSRLAKSIEIAETQDAREAIKDEKNSGLFGVLANVVAPRMSEHADRDIMAGEQTDGYLKDYVLDVGEDALMTAGTPVTGAAKAVTGTKAVSKAYKNFKKGKKAFDKRTNLNKYLNTAGSVVGYAADNALVPAVTEVADAVAYDDPENPRSEFSGEDVVVGATVNGVAPLIFGRTGGRLAAYLPANIRGNVKNIAKKAEPVMEKADPFIVNKYGKSEMAKRVPYVSDIVAERNKNVDEINKEAERLAERKMEWEKGLHIPTSPKDEYWEEFVKWGKAKANKQPIIIKYIK